MSSSYSLGNISSCRTNWASLKKKLDDCIQSRSTVYWHRDVDACRWFVAVSVISFTAVHHHRTDADSATRVESVFRSAVGSPWTSRCSRFAATNVVIVCAASRAIKQSAFPLPFVYFRIKQILFRATHAAFSQSDYDYVLTLLHRKSWCTVYYLWSLLVIRCLQETLSSLVSAWVVWSCHFDVLFKIECLCVANLFIYIFYIGPSTKDIGMGEGYAECGFISRQKLVGLYQWTVSQSDNTTSWMQALFVYGDCCFLIL